MVLQTLPAILQERIDPSLDNALLYVMLTGGIHDRLVRFDDLQYQRGFPLRTPSLDRWVVLLLISLPPLFLFTAYHWYSL